MWNVANCCTRVCGAGEMSATNRVNSPVTHGAARPPAAHARPGGGGCAQAAQAVHDGVGARATSRTTGANVHEVSTVTR